MPTCTLTEYRIYKCSCDPNLSLTEKEMKDHARSHKAAGDRVLLEPLGGYSFEI